MTSFVETVFVPILYDKVFLFIYLYKHPFSEGILLNLTFCSEIEASRALISIKVTNSLIALSDASEIWWEKGKGKGRIDSNRFRLWNFLMQIIFQYYIFTKAIQNRPNTFANICHLSSFMPQLCFTGSSEFDSLYMALNYNIMGIYGCSSGNQEYCWFSKANEPAFFYLSSSF